MPARNARPFGEPDPAHIVARRAAWAATRQRDSIRDLPLTEPTRIDDAHIIRTGKYSVDIVAGERVIGANADGRLIDLHSRNLARLPVDPGFWATLRGPARADYLAGHTADGVRRGRILLHTLADGRTFLTLPYDGGYCVIPIDEVRRGADGVWREV
nr:hypothetical protein [Corynebacterium lactis]